MELLVISAISLAATIFVLWPLMRGEAGPKEALVLPIHVGRENLLREKEAAIRALKEIEFDYISGKLSYDDYSSLNSSYENRVVRLLRELDEYDTEDHLSQAVEAEIKAVRRRKTKGGGSCLQCGFPVPAGSNYCPACGSRVNQEGVDGDK